MWTFLGYQEPTGTYAISLEGDGGFDVVFDDQAFGSVTSNRVTISDSFSL